MSTQGNSSFIPKQTRHEPRSKQKRRVSFPFFSVFAHSIFIASLLGAAGVFIYNQYTIKQLEQSATRLEQSINTFQVSDLEAVVDFDNRIKAAESLLNDHVSIVRLLEALEQSVVTTIGITSVQIERLDRSQLSATVVAESPELDFIIFQRDFLQNPNLSTVADVNITNLVYEPMSTEDTNEQGKRVTFDIEASFNASDLSVDAEQIIMTSDNNSLSEDVSDVSEPEAVTNQPES